MLWQGRKREEIRGSIIAFVATLSVGTSRALTGYLHGLLDGYFTGTYRVFIISYVCCYIFPFPQPLLHEPNREPFPSAAF